MLILTFSSPNNVYNLPGHLDVPHAKFCVKYGRISMQQLDLNEWVVSEQWTKKYGSLSLEMCQ
jgi:hypothetical protein